MGRKSANIANYVTVQELSAIVGRSKQSIYRRMTPDNPFWKYVHSFKGIKMVHKAAISEVYGIEYEFAPNYEEAIEDQAETNDSTQLLKLLQGQIEKKDKQISDMQRTIDNLHEALNAEQLLNGQNTLRIQELTALIAGGQEQAGDRPGADQDTRQDKAAPGADQEQAGDTQPDSTKQEPEQQKSIWQRIRAAIGF